MHSSKEKSWHEQIELDQNGKPLNGCIKDTKGILYRYKNRLLHCESGPAIKTPDGSEHWLINGQFHRINGPARKWSDGEQWWFLNGEQVSEDEVMIPWEKSQLEPSLKEATMTKNKKI